MNAHAWRVTLAAALLMALVVGGRSAFGMFVGPINSASGIGLAAFSFALALGQLAVGFAQPWVGAIADRHGAARPIVIGALLLAMCTALPVFAPWPPAVAFAVIAGAVAGCAVASNGLLIGEVTRAVPPARAGLAVGIVGGGTSLGLLLLGPATQWAIAHQGWAWALLATALLTLVAWPLARPFRRPAGQAPARPSQPVADVMRDRRFWRVALSFGVCGFHVSFMALHMPGVIERCGLPPSLAGNWIALCGLGNIVGSVIVGWMLRRHDAAPLLAALYLVRAAAVLALLLLPTTPTVMLGFAVVMGASFMATLPPTSALLARHHGVTRLGTLMGVVMLVHQVGGFAGIALGGWIADATGADTGLWLIDLALALAAAALVWPLRQARAVVPAAGAAAAAAARG